MNFVADPAIVSPLLPAPFSPKLYNGKAVVGICLIRLQHVRPKGIPSFIGLSSENAAHRFAVEWEDKGQLKSGVYIPRRDSSSFFNHLVGGRLFPGVHHYTGFDVREEGSQYHIAFKSKKGDVSLSLDARRTTVFPSSSIFDSLANASAFFEKGTIGYSPKSNTYDGLELRTFGWKVEPLEVVKVSSRFFDNEKVFPKGSVVFDNALLMTGLEHEWHQVKAPGQSCTV